MRGARSEGCVVNVGDKSWPMPRVWVVGGELFDVESVAGRGSYFG